MVGNEILCVEDGYLQHSGTCNDDEYCMGTTHLHEAECGTENLCKKGYIQLELGITQNNFNTLIFNRVTLRNFSYRPLF